MAATILIDKKLFRQKNREWDECDPIATAILALIRAQNIVQSVHDANAYVGVAHAKYEKAYKIRENAIQQLMAAQPRFRCEEAVERQAIEQRRGARGRARQRLIRLATENGEEML